MLNKIGFYFLFFIIWIILDWLLVKNVNMKLTHLLIILKHAGLLWNESIYTLDFCDPSTHTIEILTIRSFLRQNPYLIFNFFFILGFYEGIEASVEQKPRH